MGEQINPRVKYDFTDVMETLCLHFKCNSDGEDKEAGRKKEIIGSFEDLLWRILGTEGRSELRLWLCTDLGSLRDVPRQLQAFIFLSLIRPEAQSTLDELLCRQTLRVACERQPRRVMRLFSRDSKLVRNFFSGHTKRILDWFEKFSSSQRREKELGAQALAQFAFRHRHKFWKELEWQGTHGQAPATLASKPHYFLDLDVLKTVENFLDYVPEFWSSDELWDSLKEGDLLSLDMDFFVGKLLERMEDGSSTVWKMLEEFFYEENFMHLCNRLLSFLNDQKLLRFVNELSQGLTQASHTEARKTDIDSWLVKVLQMGVQCPSLECMMICNACVTHARQLVRLLQVGESVEDCSFLDTSLLEITNSTQQKHHAFWKDCLQWNKWELVKGLALEAWAIQVLMSKERTSTASLRALLSANSIQFRHSSSEEKRKANRLLKQRKESKKKKKKKKRRMINADSSSDKEVYSSVSDSDIADNGSWYLSFQNFDVVLEKDELPERLSSFAFMQWLNWVTSHH